MASFADVESEQPEFAEKVRAVFDAHGHKILGTLRADGAPRLSGIEASFAGGQLWLAGMPRSLKFADLRRDPRFALHSGSDDPDVWRADAKVSGRAVEVADEQGRVAFAAVTGQPADGGFELFRGDLELVVLTALNDDRSALVITSWRPGRGLEETQRD